MTDRAGGYQDYPFVAEYLDRGGRLLVMLDTLVGREKAKPSGLDGLLAQYGVVVNQDSLALAAEVEIAARWIADETLELEPGTTLWPYLALMVLTAAAVLGRAVAGGGRCHVSRE